MEDPKSVSAEGNSEGNDRQMKEAADPVERSASLNKIQQLEEEIANLKESFKEYERQLNNPMNSNELKMMYGNLMISTNQRLDRLQTEVSDKAGILDLHSFICSLLMFSFIPYFTFCCVNIHPSICNNSYLTLSTF